MTVDYPGSGGRFTTVQFPGHYDMGVVDAFHSAFAAESVEILLHRGEGREVLMESAAIGNRW